MTGVAIWLGKAESKFTFQKTCFVTITVGIPHCHLHTKIWFYL